MKYVSISLLFVLLLSGCDPAATALIRADVSSGQAARQFAVAYLEGQQFSSRPQQNAKPACSYLWRTQIASKYPHGKWTTYVDVCASDTVLSVELMDYPRFTLSAETSDLRDHLASILAEKFVGVDVHVE